MKKLSIHIRTCYECPFLRYFLGGHGTVTPAHYSCGQPCAEKKPARFIALKVEGWHGEIPNWCPMPDYHETEYVIIGFKGWET